MSAHEPGEIAPSAAVVDAGRGAGVVEDARGSFRASFLDCAATGQTVTSGVGTRSRTVRNDYLLPGTSARSISATSTMVSES